MIEETERMISLRPAVVGDSDLLLSWRNRPDIVALGSLNRAVSRGEHAIWFANKLSSDDSIIWIVQNNGLPIGQVRLDPIAPHEKIISIFILADHVGRGFGVDAIKRACVFAFDRWKNLKRIRANILKDNSRSIRSFEKSGFGSVRRGREHDGMLSLFLPRPILVPHNRLTHGAEETAAVAKVVRSGQWAGGRKVEEFEGHLQDWARVEHAVCVGSGVAALRLSLSAIGVAEGDEVLVPGYSCVALPNAVLANRAIPVVADIEERTWNINLQKINDIRLGSSVKAVIAVNTFGCPLDMDELHKLKIDCVEDWAHGFCLDAEGKSPAGLISKVAIQSFYATKLIGVGEGGVVLTNSPDIAGHVRRWRDYADQLSDATRLNDKMTDISASIGIVQLKRLPDIIQRRAELASRYTAAFSSSEWLHEYVDFPGDDTRRVWYRYPIYLKYWDAQDFIARMRDVGVMADMPVCDWRSSLAGGCQVTERAFRRIVSLPLYPSLNAKEQAHVIKTFFSVSQSYIEKHGKL